MRQTHSLISSLSSSSTSSAPAKMNAVAINKTKCERMSTHVSIFFFFSSPRDCSVCLLTFKNILQYCSPSIVVTKYEPGCWCGGSCALADQARHCKRGHCISGNSPCAWLIFPSLYLKLRREISIFFWSHHNYFRICNTETTQYLSKANIISSIDSQQQQQPPPPPQIEGPYSDAVLLKTSTEPLKEFTFSRIWDKNGLLWWLGTEQGTKTEWTNPATSGIIHVTVSSMNQCVNQGRITSASAFVDRNHLNMCFTNDERGSWVEVDLVHFRIRPTHYTLRSDKHLRHKLRNWVLQGRNDLESEWVTLSTHIADRTISDYFPFSAGSWPITSATPPSSSSSSSPSSSPSSLSSSSYRYLRILQTGENSYNYHCLMMAGFEVYGQLFPSHHQA